MKLLKGRFRDRLQQYVRFLRSNRKAVFACHYLPRFIRKKILIN